MRFSPRPHVRALATLIVTLLALAPVQAQPTVQTVFYSMPENLLPEFVPTPTAQLLAVPGYPYTPGQLTFIARLYLPDPAAHGPGPFPVVLFLHGSGGFWSNDTIPNPITAANAPARQFRDWGNLLAGLGYAALFPDSYNPRGIASDFEGRRPHHNPAEDDALCSPNYERPKDVVAALEYLVSRADLDHDQIALVAFSQGAQTGMNALLDASVDRGTYDVDYVDLVEQPPGSGVFAEQTSKKVVPPPVRIPAHLPIPKFCAFYYGGGSHYGYHGQASSTAAGRYMLDRRTTAILFHGTDDYLMGVTNHDASPIAASAFPLKQVLASAAQAATLGQPNPIVRHYLFDRTSVHTPSTARVEHSFDLGGVTIAAPADWDTANETPNQKARRLARDEVLRWLAFKLKPAPALTITPDPDSPATQIRLAWPAPARLRHTLERSADLAPGAWLAAASTGDGTGETLTHLAPRPASGERVFYRLRLEPSPMPVSEPEHAGFFKTYADFGL